METLSQGKDKVVAAVDMKLRLESLTAEQTATGSWLNIIGYVTSITPFGAGTGPSRKHGYRVGIQAVLHSPAVSVEPAKYEEYVRLQAASATG
jgi:hypothetical protein